MNRRLLPFSVLLFCAAAMAQQPTVAPDKAVPFASVEAVGAIVPENINLRPSGNWSVIAAEQANEAILANALNRPAVLRLKVQIFEPYKENGWGYRIMAPDAEVAIHGTRIPYRIWAFFRQDQAQALAKVHVGSIITLSGTLGRADIKMYDGHPALTLDLHEAKVETSGRTPSEIVAEAEFQQRFKKQAPR